MQNERKRQLSDPFNMFDGFGNFSGFGGSIFGRNPFDDPFFTHPFGTMFRSGNSLHQSPLVPPSGPVIEELDLDDDNEEEKETNVVEGHGSARPVSKPFVDHPDDENNDDTEQSNSQINYNRAGGTQAQSFKVHSCKVTYGGIDGVYYSSSATRRMGNDGMIMEDCKEADKRTGEATHRISRGLHDKGHSVTRKLNSDGKVDMLRTLHNLKEDELGSFEEAWKSNGGQDMPSGSSDKGVDRMSNWEGFLLPSTNNTRYVGGSERDNGNVADHSRERTKKVVRIPID